MSSSVDIDNKNKYILILGEGPTQGLDDTTLTAEAKYPTTFIQLGKIVLSLQYNGSNSFLFVNAAKINLSVFNMIAGINELKALTKYISCGCKCKLDRKKYNLNQWWNNSKCRCECKTHHICEKDYIWNRSTCICKNGKYLASIINDSVITCDEIIDAEETKTIPKHTTCKTQNVYILLTFL